MSDGVVIKSKTNKAMKIALWLALVFIFMMILILFAGIGSDGVTNWSVINMIIGILIIVSSIWFFAGRKKRNAQKTQYDIIELVADNEHKQSARTLNVLSANVERGGAGETYVHFMKDRITYLYLEGVGVVETHIGKDIGIVKREKQRDEIAMAIAKSGIVSQINHEKLISEGLFKETVEE